MCEVFTKEPTLLGSLALEGLMITTNNMTFAHVPYGTYWGNSYNFCFLPLI